MEVERVLELFCFQRYDGYLPRCITCQILLLLYGDSIILPAVGALVSCLVIKPLAFHFLRLLEEAVKVSAECF